MSRTMYWTLDCGVIILSGAFLLLLLLTFKPCTGLWRINYAVLQSLAHLEQCFGIWRFNLSGRFAATSASKRALNQRFNGLRRIDLATTQAMNIEQCAGLWHCNPGVRFTLLRGVDSVPVRGVSIT